MQVHCLRHQIAGEWEFTLGPLGPKRNACGHKNPDNPSAESKFVMLHNNWLIDLSGSKLKLGKRTWPEWPEIAGSKSCQANAR